MRVIAVLVTVLASTSVLAADRAIQPIEPAQIAEEAVRLCARDLRDESGLREALDHSRYALEETARTLQGVRANWSTSFGWVYYIELPNPALAHALPQCNVEAISSVAVVRSEFEELVSAALESAGYDELEKTAGVRATTWLLKGVTGGDIALIWPDASSEEELIVLSFQPAASAKIVAEQPLETGEHDASVSAD